MIAEMLVLDSRMARMDDFITSMSALPASATRRASAPNFIVWSTRSVVPRIRPVNFSRAALVSRRAPACVLALAVSPLLAPARWSERCAISLAVRASLAGTLPWSASERRKLRTTK